MQWRAHLTSGAVPPGARHPPSSVQPYIDDTHSMPSSLQQDLARPAPKSGPGEPGMRRNPPTGLPVSLLISFFSPVMPGMVEKAQELGIHMFEGKQKSGISPVGTLEGRAQQGGC